MPGVRLNRHWSDGWIAPVLSTVVTIALVVAVALGRLDPAVLIGWLAGLHVPNPVERSE